MRKKTKERIINAAMTVLAKNPYATFDEVVVASDISRATIYRYFPSREVLIRELYLEAERRGEVAMGPIMKKNLPASEMLEEIIRVIIPMGDTFRFLYVQPVSEDDPVIREIYANDRQFFLDLIDRLTKEGVIDPAIPPEWAAHVLDGLIYAAWEACASGEIAPKSAPDLLLRSFLHGLKKPDTPA